MSDDLILPEAPPRVRALVYDAATGRIECIVTCATLAAAEMQAGDGRAMLVTGEGDGGALFYCPGGVLTARPSARLRQDDDRRRRHRRGDARHRRRASP